MSYILDALKKAERQRSLGQVPTLESSYAEGSARRRRAWPWIWAAVLAVNGILLMLILRHPENPPSASQSAAARQPVTASQPSAGGRPGSPPILAINQHVAVPAPVITASAQAAIQAWPAAASVTTMPVSSDSAARVVMPAAPPAGPAPPAAAQAKPVQMPSGRAESHAAPAVQKSAVQHRPPAAASHSSPPVRLTKQQGHAAVPAARAAVSAPIATPVLAATPPALPSPSKPSPSRPAPAAPATAPPPERAPAVAASQPSAGADAASAKASAAPPGPASIPLLRELPFEFQKSVPPVRIDAMVYSEDQQARMAFLNGHKYREGQQLEGSNLRVESILRQGVVLSLGGQRFLLIP